MPNSISSSIHPAGIVWHPMASRTSGRFGSTVRAEIVMFQRRIYDESWRARQVTLDEPEDGE